MADPEARLRELIDALNDEGLSWLALEILAAIDHGLLTEESEAVLSAARHAVRSAPADRELKWSETPSPQVPILYQIAGEEQLYWAAQYVLTRLSDAIHTSAAAQSQVNELVSTEGVARVGRVVNVEIQVGEDVLRHPLVSNDATERQLNDLDVALNRWLVSSVRKDGQ